MPKLRHALSGAVYDVLDDGRIRVEKDDHVGYFTREGRHLEGDVRYADPHLCGWLAGVQLPSRHQQAAEHATTGGAS